MVTISYGVICLSLLDGVLVTINRMVTAEMLQLNCTIPMNLMRIMPTKGSSQMGVLPAVFASNLVHPDER